jgi:uncharacterized coiled-coil protein SlyX
MDNELIAAIVAVLLAAAGWLKSHSEVEGVKKDRETTKMERDTKIALLEQKVAEHDKMMENGNERFDRIERELKETNGLLRELVGMFKMSTRARSHTPEDGPC